MIETGVLVAARNLSKSFPGTRALDGVSLEVRPGEIHALCGANGSGKSTLVKILTGVYQPDTGTISVGGRELQRFSSPAEAVAAGVRVVHQEAPLINTFTVEECIALFHGYPTGPSGRVRWRAVRATARAILDRLEIAVAPTALCGSLGPSERAMVALAIALGPADERAALLILDEATAAIPEESAGPFLARVRRVADLGSPVLMVTHRVSEVPAVADRVTVLADGHVVHSGAAVGLTEDQLVNYVLISAPEDLPQAASTAAQDTEDPGQMPSETVAAGAGRGPLAALLPGRERTGLMLGTPVLLVEHLVAERLMDISFTVAAGEIVGVAGLADSGISELPAVLAGAAPRVTGDIRVGGRALPPGAEPRDAIDAGIALVPGDRLRQGGIQTLTLHENMILPQVGRFWRRGRDERRMIEGAVQALDIHPADPQAVLAGFSGGNQQRAIIGKWLLMGPQVLVLDDPTSGVDPRARQAIFALLREAAANGLGILFFSTEPEQLVLMCSRILVLRHGSIVQTLSGSELSRDNVARWSAM